MKPKHFLYIILIIMIVIGIVQFYGPTLLKKVDDTEVADVKDIVDAPEEEKETKAPEETNEDIQPSSPDMAVIAFVVDENKGAVSGEARQEVKLGSSPSELTVPEIQAKPGFVFLGWDKALPENIEESMKIVALFNEVKNEFEAEVDENFNSLIEGTVASTNKIGVYKLSYIKPMDGNLGVFDFDLQGENVDMFSLSGTGLKSALSQYFSGAKTGQGTCAKYLEKVEITNNTKGGKSTTLDKNKLTKINTASKADIPEFLPLIGLFSKKADVNQLTVKFIYEKDGETYEREEIFNIIK